MMDSTGRIHEFSDVLRDGETRKEAEKRLQALAAAMDNTLAEQGVGPLVPISERELPTVRKMSMEDRRAWYESRTKAKLARKRQRAARKRQRR